MKAQSYYVNQHAGDGSWSDLFGDIYSGIAVGLGHSMKFVEFTLHQAMDAIASMIRLGSTVSMTPTSGNDEQVDRTKRSLKVVGVGYGRTGTYSLALALDELGFPTLHTQHLYENPKLFNHMSNTIFFKSILEDRTILGQPDLDLIVQAGYTGTMDLPFALYFDQIQEQYPECKFILTVRENSEIWYQSWNVLAESIVQPAMYTSFLFSHVKKLENYMRWLFSVVNNDTRYLNHPFPLPRQNKRNAIASYANHNQSVRDSIPPSRLLEYDVRQGWEPLCHFLDIPKRDCPLAKGIPFPKSNSARAVRWQCFMSVVGIATLSVFVVFTIVFLVFRNVIGMSVGSWCALQRVRLLHWASKSLTRRREKARSGVVKKD